ncbi:MAG TPA: response regulator, partial [Opitutaceae bacterium]|nr:response regulator [Opitutaceae bacterium]
MIAKQILVIDDQPLIRDLLGRFLQADGHRVITAVDGREGLAKARALPPDLILLDVDIPALNGFEVCATLKDEPATASVPVVFISARLSIHDRGRMEAAGAAGFLAKPFSLAQLRGVVGSLLGMAA